MVLKRPALILALVASLTVALPSAAADAKPPEPVAQAAGDPVPLDPAVVGVPIMRTTRALDSASAAIDAGKGATAARRLVASRRHLIRSYRGARYLIANMPPAPIEEARANAGARKFRRLARRFVRTLRAEARSQGGWIKAQASGDPVGPVFADAPTAVFSVFTSQYEAATTSVGLLPDVTGNLLTRVTTTLNTAVILRNRLVRVVAAAAPPPPPEDARVGARAAQEADDVTTFDVVMPGVAVLLSDEIQQIQATMQDASVPAAARNALGNVLAADNQILNRVNALWPPELED